MKKEFSILMLILTISVSINISAEPVNWRFQIGGMKNILRTPTYKESLDFFTKYSFLLGAEIQIPLKNNWFLESGVNFRNGPETYTYTRWDDPGYTAEFIPLKYFNKDGDYNGPDEFMAGKYRKPEIYSGTSNFIDLPIRAGWKWKINEDNEFQFSLGPAITFHLEKPYEFEYGSNCLSIGVSPSIVYKHRALSLGLYYQNPCIYNGSKNRETNTLMFTIGVNFNGRKPNWDNVLSGLEVAGNVLGTVSESMGSYYSSSSNSYSKNYNSNSSTSGNSGNYEALYRNWERRAESNYNSLTNLGYDVIENGKHSGGSGSGKVSSGNYTQMKRSLREAQKEMKSIRSKANKAGITIQKSKWEDATVKY